MSLDIEVKAGQFDPWVKYNGKAGRWYVKDGENEKEVKDPVFVADFAKVKLGWFYFKAGSAPQKVFDPAPKPKDNYIDDKGVQRDCFKRGFEMRLFSKAHFGGVVLITGASMHLNNAISALHTAYEISPESKQGLLPVVKCTGTEAMKDKMGTNYKPVFVIEKWVTRPAELDATVAPSDQNQTEVMSIASEF